MMKLNKNKVGIGIAVVVAAAVIFGPKLMPKQQAAAVERTATVTTQDLRQVLKADGVVTLTQEQHLFVANTALVTGRYAAVGNQVKAGQILLELDTSDLRERLAQAKYQLLADQDALKDSQNSGNSSSKASYERAASAYSRAKADYESAKTLMATGAISQTELDQYQSKMESSYSDMVSASEKLQNNNSSSDIQKMKEKIASDQLTIKNLEADIEAALIKAPMDGTVISLAEKTQGMLSAGTLAATVADLGALRVEAMISEYDTAKIQVGQTVEVNTLGNETKIYSGVIESIDPKGTAKNDEVLVKTMIKLSEVDEQIKPNFTVSINIETASKKGALAVPYEALTKKDAETYLVTRINGETREEITVKKGLETDLYAELLTDQVKPGDLLAIPTDKGANGDNERKVGPGSGNNPVD